MAVKDSYTLQDFATYARENFPVEFDSIADPSVYKFVLGAFPLKDISIGEGDILRIACIIRQSTSSEHENVSLWSRSDGDKIFYYYDGPTDTIVSTCNPFWYWVGVQFRAPFSFLAERPWPSKRLPLQSAKDLAADQLDLFVKFVFLLTGRVAKIFNPRQEDLLVFFKDMCMHMQQNKQAEEKTRQQEQGKGQAGTLESTNMSQAPLEDTQVAAEGTSVQTKESAEAAIAELKQHDQSQNKSRIALQPGSMSNFPSFNLKTLAPQEPQRRMDELREQLIKQQQLAKKARNLERVVLPWTVDKTSDSVLPQKRVLFDQASNEYSRKRPRTDSPNNTADVVHSSSGTSAPLSLEMQTLLASLVQQCKNQLKAEADHQDEASQVEVAKLRVESSALTRRVEEDAVKIDEMRIMHESAKEQARHWKEKFDKLNKKVQIFMKDE